MQGQEKEKQGSRLVRAVFATRQAARQQGGDAEENFAELLEHALDRDVIGFAYAASKVFGNDPLFRAIMMDHAAVRTAAQRLMAKWGAS